MLQGRSLSNDMQTVFMPVRARKIQGLEFEIEIARTEHILFYGSCGTHSIFRYFFIGGTLYIFSFFLFEEHVLFFSRAEHILFFLIVSI